MENQEKGYLSPEIGGGKETPGDKEKNQEKPSNEARRPELTNDLVQADGSYNPKYWEWLCNNLYRSALALSEIPTSLSPENKVTMNPDEANELVSFMQLFCHRVCQEEETILGALEFYNYYRDFITFKGLQREFGQFLCNKRNYRNCTK